jgi:GT2 family glycosyltransferase
MTPDSVLTVAPGPPPGATLGERLPQEQPVSVASPAGLASILIPCCGQLEYTRLCLPGLLKHTRPPFELIFIDAGSLDGTAVYLSGFAAGASGLRVEVVRTPTDLGLGQAVQQALSRARGEFIVLVNNDCLVTEYWLLQLCNLAKLSPTIGLAGPMSNYAAPPQLVEDVPYRVGPRKGGIPLDGDALVDTSAVDGFARQWREQHRGQWLESERLGGFCLLVKREVFKRIGHLREAGDLSLFDTDLLSARARQAGFTLAVCRDCFVHHFGTRTFAHGGES